MEEKKELRRGFTTGSCSAAAAKAAVYMLLTGGTLDQISIETPAGIRYHAKIQDVRRSPGSVSCAVLKDGGDDPDVTTGLPVRAQVSAQEIDFQEPNLETQVFIDGGEGVGRVTLPGLDQPVGNAAINRVPRQMIEQEVRDVTRVLDFHGRIQVIISVPGGQEVAERTFNPRLGIQGGISILGTSGIVEPMSTQAILDTISVELSQRKELGYREVAVTPGNYGQRFMQEAYGYDLDQSVKCSNYIGDTIDRVKELEFQGMLLTGHIGKLIKVSGGMMNTHSREGDGRMEFLAAALIRRGGSGDVARKVLSCKITEEALRMIQEESAELFHRTMEEVMDRIMFYLKKRAGAILPVECILYSSEFGLLASSKGAMEMLLRIQEQSEEIKRSGK